MDLSFVGSAEIKWATETIEQALIRFRTSPDFDEICAEAFHDFWFLLARQKDDQAWIRREGFIRMVCRRVIHRFPCSFFNSRRTINKGGFPLPELVSLDEGEDYERFKAVEPDFVPELVERLWREEVWEVAFRLLKPEEARLVAEWLRGEKTYSRADQQGLHKIHRLLNRYRGLVGARKWLMNVRSPAKKARENERRREKYREDPEFFARKRREARRKQKELALAEQK